MSDIFDPDKDAHRVATRKARGAQRVRDLELVAIMEMPLGRSWIWGFLSDLHVYSSPFGENVHMSYFAGGEKNVGLRLMADILRVCPELYWTMLKERVPEDERPSDASGANSDADA